VRDSGRPNRPGWDWQHPQGQFVCAGQWGASDTSAMSSCLGHGRQAGSPSLRRKPLIFMLAPLPPAALRAPRCPPPLQAARPSPPASASSPSCGRSLGRSRRDSSLRRPAATCRHHAIAWPDSAGTGRAGTAPTIGARESSGRRRPVQRWENLYVADCSSIPTIPWGRRYSTATGPRMNARCACNNAGQHRPIDPRE
jgi:hypothetical protein